MSHSTPGTSPLASSASTGRRAWRLLVIGWLLFASVACMRDEPAEPPAWYVQSVIAGWRRYPVEDTDGARQMTVRRRGPTASIIDADGRALARLGVRRETGQVVARAKDGISGHTTASATDISYLDADGKTTARLIQTAASSWRFEASDGAPFATLETKPGDDGVQTTTARDGERIILTVRELDDELQVERTEPKASWTVSRRVGLGTTGMALLALEGPELGVRAAIALHLTEMPPGVQEAPPAPVEPE